MESNITEKEFYKGQILGMIDGIDNVDVLLYIYVVIRDVVQEQDWRGRVKKGSRKNRLPLFLFTNHIYHVYNMFLLFVW